MGRVKRKNNGFTLIELIVSIGILGIIVVAFSGMFLSGFNTIAQSGNRSSGDYEAQKVMESKISNPTAGVDGNVATTVDNTELNIKFGSKEIQVPGKRVESEFNDGKSTVIITTFVPD